MPASSRKEGAASPPKKRRKKKPSPALRAGRSQASPLCHSTMATTARPRVQSTKGSRCTRRVMANREPFAQRYENNRSLYLRAVVGVDWASSRANDRRPKRPQLQGLLLSEASSEAPREWHEFSSCRPRKDRATRRGDVQVDQHLLGQRPSAPGRADRGVPRDSARPVRSCRASRTARSSPRSRRTCAASTSTSCSPPARP